MFICISIGRKRTIQFASVFALIAGIIQAAATEVGMLIAGRIIGGFAVGIMSKPIGSMSVLR